MERQGRVNSASSSGRSGSRKRIRSTSPTEDFRKPKDTQVSRPTSRASRPSLMVKTDGTTTKDQPKITNYKSKQTSKMAPPEKDKAGEKQTLSEFEKLVLEKLQNLESNMQEIKRKLNVRIEKLESRVHDIEQIQDKCVKDIESIQRKQQLGEELITSNENVAKISYDKSMSNEQYTRKFNVRIFNLEEHDRETISECEQKGLKLFKERLNVDVPIEAIDVLHRVGPKQHAQAQDNTVNNENKTPKSVDNVGQSADASAPSSKSDSKNGPNKKQTKSYRPIIVNFISRRKRREVLANRFRLKKKSKDEIPIILAEDLTKQNHALLCKVKMQKKLHLSGREMETSMQINIMG